MISPRLLAPLSLLLPALFACGDDGGGAGGSASTASSGSSGQGGALATSSSSSGAAQGGGGQGGSGTGGAGQGGSATGGNGAGGAGQGGSPFDGPLDCSDVPAIGGGLPSHTDVFAVPPAPAGGTPTEGRYRLTSITSYVDETNEGDCNDPAPPAAASLRSAWDIEASTARLVIEGQNGPILRAGAWEVVDTEFEVTLTCPMAQEGDVISPAFTFAGDTFTTYNRRVNEATCRVSDLLAYVRE